MRYSKNAEFNGRSVHLIPLPDETEVLYINDRGEFNIESVGALSYAQALQITSRRARQEGVVLEMSGQQQDWWLHAITRRRNDD